MFTLMANNAEGGAADGAFPVVWCPTYLNRDADAGNGVGSMPRRHLASVVTESRGWKKAVVDAPLNRRHNSNGTMQTTPAHEERVRHWRKRFMAEGGAETSFSTSVRHAPKILRRDDARPMEYWPGSAGNERVIKTTRQGRGRSAAVVQQKKMNTGRGARVDDLNGDILGPPARMEGRDIRGTGKEKRRTSSLAIGSDNGKNAKTAPEEWVGGRGLTRDMEQNKGRRGGKSRAGLARKNRVKDQWKSRQEGWLKDTEAEKKRRKDNVENGEEIAGIRRKDASTAKPTQAVKLAWVPGDPCLCVGAPGVIGEACRGWLRSRAVTTASGEDERMRLELGPSRTDRESLEIGGNVSYGVGRVNVRAKHSLSQLCDDGVVLSLKYLRYVHKR